MLYFLHLAFSVLVMSPAAGSDWTLTTVGGPEFKFYVDLASRVRSGDRVEAWQKQVTSDGERDFSKLLYVNDCRSRRRALRTSIYFDAIGAIISQRTRTDAELDWQPVVPDSPGEEFFRLACQ